MPTRFPMLTLFPCIAALPFSAPVMAAERHMPPATAYVRQGDTYIVSVPGMGIRLTHDGHNEAPLWSPDGRYLTYVKDGKAGHSALCIHDTETGFRRIIRDLDTDTAAPDDYRSVARGARIRAWIAAPNGMDAHMLATDAGYGDTRPQWLDRDHIVFGRWRRDSASMDLWTCDKRGRGLTRIDSEVAEDGYAVRPFSH